MRTWAKDTIPALPPLAKKSCWYPQPCAPVFRLYEVRGSPAPSLSCFLCPPPQAERTRKCNSPINNRDVFREWLASHPNETECWVHVKRGRPVNGDVFYYLDAVEEALCFGWIDSTYKKIDGVVMQRFTPRKKNSPWTELNKERVRRLEKLDLMTDRGRAALPSMGVRSFQIDPDIVAAMKQARVWSKFRTFHPLYQRIRAYNVAFYKTRNPEVYNQVLTHLIEETKKGRMYGEWNDYGRLLDY